VEKEKQMSLSSILGLLIFPLLVSGNNLLFYGCVLKKKLYVVNNILNYIKKMFAGAPNSFHDKYSVDEKYKCYTTCIWGFDSVGELAITICSSLLKIIILSLGISFECMEVGIMIIFFNLILLFVIPKIADLMEGRKNKENNRKYYSSAYYSVVLDEENRVNPILYNIQNPCVNESLEKLMLRYWNTHKINNFTELLRNIVKTLLLIAIFLIAYWKNDYELIMVMYLNKSTIFGFSDVYEEFKKTENYNKKHMEELNLMLEDLSKFYSDSEIKVLDDITKKGVQECVQNLIVRDLNYSLYGKSGELIKNLSSDKLLFNFSSEKKIVQISGKTGCGKSLLTKIISGQTDTHDYLLENGLEFIENFSQLSNQRIIINQKVGEDYSYNSAIKLSLDKLYPNAKDFEEVRSFISRFNIQHKIASESLDSYFQEKLSGGEHQRVALSSLIWKILKQNPAWIVIDEPEKGIDEETIIKIMDWFLSVYKGLVFIITHNQTIKSKYLPMTQSIIKYKFNDESEISTVLFQEFL
jgi:ABC-type transport system involved in cytochrome bd biosynthesis fused ATPase/permease subunit